VIIYRSKRKPVVRENPLSSWGGRGPSEGLYQRLTRQWSLRDLVRCLRRGHSDLLHRRFPLAYGPSRRLCRRSGWHLESNCPPFSMTSRIVQN